MRPHTLAFLLCLTSLTLGDEEADKADKSAKPATPAEGTAADAAKEEAAAGEAAEEEPAGPTEDDILAALEDSVALADKIEQDRLAAVAEARENAVGQKVASIKTSAKRSKTYNKVTITGIDDIGIKVRHEAGTARIKFQDLPELMQAEFGYDQGKALAQQQAEEEAKRAHVQKAIAGLRREAGVTDSRNKRRPTASPSRTSSGRNSEKINALEGKISTLEMGVEKVQGVVQTYEAKALKHEQEASDSTTAAKPIEGAPKVSAKARLAKRNADRERAKAEAERAKIEAANELIRKYKDELHQLKRR